MLVATVRACPVIGGKLKSFDAAKVEKMAGVKKVLAIDGNAVVVVADTYWNARTALAALPAEWDVGKLGEVQTGHDQGHAQGRPRRRRGLRRQQGRRRQGRDRRRGQEGGGDLQLPLPAPRHHGADERDGPRHRRQVRGVVRHAERRGGARRGGGSLRPAGRASATSTRCCWAAASAGAAAPTTSARPCWSPRRCRARRSS